MLVRCTDHEQEAGITVCCSFWSVMESAAVRRKNESPGSSLDLNELIHLLLSHRMHQYDSDSVLGLNQHENKIHALHSAAGEHASNIYEICKVMHYLPFIRILIRGTDYGHFENIPLPAFPRNSIIYSNVFVNYYKI